MNLADFPIGPFFLSTGGVIFLIGIALSSWMLSRTVHEKGLSLQFLNDRLLIFTGVAFIFGRAGALGKFWSYLERGGSESGILSEVLTFLQKFLLFWHGGIDTFWTAIGFLVTFFLLSFWKKENLWKWLDAFVLPTILLLIFWNLGAFFSAWDYGRPVSDNFIFGVTYNINAVRYSVPLHPVQIYAFCYYGLLFFVGLKWWRAHFSKKNGTFFGAMILFVFLGNGFLEFFRGDPSPLAHIFFWEIRISQALSFGLTLLFIFFLIFHTHPEILHHERRTRVRKAENL